MRSTETRNEKLDLRLTPSTKRVLQTAALAAHRSVSEFVLESALARAEETLPDRKRFGLTAEQWKAFQEALAAPPALPRASPSFSRNRVSSTAAASKWARSVSKSCNAVTQSTRLIAAVKLSIFS